MHLRAVLYLVGQSNLRAMKILAKNLIKNFNILMNRQNNCIFTVLYIQGFHRPSMYRCTNTPSIPSQSVVPAPLKLHEQPLGGVSQLKKGVKHIHLTSSSYIQHLLFVLSHQRKKML